MRGVLGEWSLRELHGKLSDFIPVSLTCEFLSTMGRSAEQNSMYSAGDYERSLSSRKGGTLAR